MKLSPLLFLLPITSYCVAANAQDAAPTNAPTTTRAAFEDWAGRADSFNAGDFIYGRLVSSGSRPSLSGNIVLMPSSVPKAPISTERLQEMKSRAEAARLADEKSREFQQSLQQFLAASYPLEELRELTRHPNPRVRTLALAAIFEREDARLLPIIRESMRDTAPTFNDKLEPQDLPSLMLYSGIDPRPKRQTVGQIATMMVDFHLRRTGCEIRDWEKYRAIYGARAWSAGEFKVKLERAKRGTSPVYAASAPALKRVRAEIEALPRADRNWLLLALWQPQDLAEGAQQWASEAEVMEAARELGAPQLLRMLQHEAVSTDPDLQFCPDGNAYWRNMKGFVLSHAPQLLKPEMADALLLAERSDASESLWAQAAAELQPRRAAPILKTALKSFAGHYEGRQRGSLMATLWRLNGEPETEFLLDWLWAETLDVETSSASAPSVFMETLANAPATPTKRLAARLLGDARLQNLPKGSLVPLARLVNDWAGQSVFDPYPLYGPENANDDKALALKRDFIDKVRAARALWAS